MEKLCETNPEKIVTLGGECSVSVVPFTFLAGKYPDDVAIVWIDAHPDVNLPYDNYNGMKERQKELGIKGLSPEEVAEDSSAILEWLKSTGVSKVVIHFDLDVLDPAEIIAGVGVEPDGMKINEVVRVIYDIASEYDLVGLTVAEPMPRVAIKIRNMLNQLPLKKYRTCLNFHQYCHTKETK